jgi:hypothetical protein
MRTNGDIFDQPANPGIHDAAIWQRPGVQAQGQQCIRWFCPDALN